MSDDDEAGKTGQPPPAQVPTKRGPIKTMQMGSISMADLEAMANPLATFDAGAPVQSPVTPSEILSPPALQEPPPAPPPEPPKMLGSGAAGTLEFQAGDLLGDALKAAPPVATMPETHSTLTFGTGAVANLPTASGLSVADPPPVDALMPDVAPPGGDGDAWGEIEGVNEALGDLEEDSLAPPALDSEESGAASLNSDIPKMPEPDGKWNSEIGDWASQAFSDEGEPLEPPPPPSFAPPDFASPALEPPALAIPDAAALTSAEEAVTVPTLTRPDSFQPPTPAAATAEAPAPNNPGGQVDASLTDHLDLATVIDGAVSTSNSHEGDVPIDFGFSPDADATEEEAPPKRTTSNASEDHSGDPFQQVDTQTANRFFGSQEGEAATEADLARPTATQNGISEQGSPEQGAPEQGTPEQGTGEALAKPPSLAVASAESTPNSSFRMAAAALLLIAVGVGGYFVAKETGILNGSSVVVATLPEKLPEKLPKKQRPEDHGKTTGSSATSKKHRTKKGPKQGPHKGTTGKLPSKTKKTPKKAGEPTDRADPTKGAPGTGETATQNGDQTSAASAGDKGSEKGSEKGTGSNKTPPVKVASSGAKPMVGMLKAKYTSKRRIRGLATALRKSLTRRLRYRGRRYGRVGKGTPPTGFAVQPYITKIATVKRRGNTLVYVHCSLNVTEQPSGSLKMSSKAKAGSGIEGSISKEERREFGLEAATKCAQGLADELVSFLKKQKR